MKDELKKAIKENGYATVYIDQLPYSVMDGDMGNEFFMCIDGFGIEHSFTYDEIGRVE